MAQTIKRGGKPARRQAAATTAKRRVEKARARTGGWWERALHALPVSPETVHRAAMVAILAGAAFAAWEVARVAGVFEAAAERIDMAASDAGFAVKRVEVRGLDRMNELKVYDQVLGTRDRAMTGLDLEAVRGQLLQLSWVKEARVSRQLPDTLVIDVVERTPRAALRKPDGSLALVDETGHELEATTPQRSRGMLVLEGDGVTGQVAALDKLLARAPAVKPQVASAQWVGHRRWNLKFRSAQTLALPEGEDQAGAALLEFARLDGIDRLLGGKVAMFDMRASDRTYLDVPGHAAEATRVASEKAAASLRASRGASPDKSTEKPAARPKPKKDD